MRRIIVPLTLALIMAALAAGRAFAVGCGHFSWAGAKTKKEEL
jgi:hypothetical protein